MIMYCQKCGKQNEDNATRCAACGEPLVQAQPTQQINIQQPAPQKKKHGCLIAFLIALGILIFIIIIASIGGKDNQTTGGENADGSVVAGKTIAEAGKIGDYNVTIKDSKVVQNGDKNILVVTYTFVNNAKDSKAFMYAVTDKLFQNGIELGTVYGSWGIENEYNFDNKSKEIKPGVTLDVQCAYELNDTTTDIEVEISEWISLNDNKLVYTILLSE